VCFVSDCVFEYIQYIKCNRLSHLKANYLVYVMEMQCVFCEVGTVFFFFRYSLHKCQTSDF
jgi:hypothetical protein